MHSLLHAGLARRTEIAISHSNDVDFGSFLLLGLRRIAFLAHGLAAHLHAMSVVHQTVEVAIGDGGIAELLVPAGEDSQSYMALKC